MYRVPDGWRSAKGKVPNAFAVTRGWCKVFQRVLWCAISRSLLKMRLPSSKTCTCIGRTGVGREALILHGRSDGMLFPGRGALRYSRIAWTTPDHSAIGRVA